MYNIDVSGWSIFSGIFQYVCVVPTYDADYGAV